MSAWVTVFCIQGDPLEGLLENAEGVEAGGGDGVDLVGHGEG